MQYDVTTPEAYINILEEDWRKETLLKIRDIILDYAPSLEETIRYKMLNFGKDDDYVFAINAQKHYVSLYVGDIDKIPDSKTLLADYNLGKGCIRVRKTIDIDETGLEQFIHRTIDIWQAGQNVDC